MTPKTYLYYNIILLDLGGQLHLDKSKRTTWKKLNTIGSSLILIIFVFSLCIDVVKKSTSDLNLVFHSYVFIGGSLWGLSKTIYYNVHNNQCKSLIFKVNSLFRHTTNTLLEDICMKKRVALTNKLTWSWCLFTIVTLIFVFLFPLLSQKRTLPFPIWVPYDWTISPYFELTYIGQSLIMWSIFISTAPTELYFVSLVLLTTEQFKLLGWEIKHLFYTTLVQNDIPRKVVKEVTSLNEVQASQRRRFKNKFNFDKIQVAIQSKQFHKDVLENFNKIIRFHQSLLLFCAELESFFSPLMLISILIIMFILIPLSVIIMTAKDLQVLLPYFPVCVYVYFQIFLSCFFGNFYTSEYERLQEDLYEVPWYECNTQYKMSMKFFTHRLSIPVAIKVGKFASLNFKLFLSAVRTVMSYCMVIYQLMQHG